MYVKKSASLFPAHLCIGIAEDKSDGSEEITLSRAITPYDDIMFRGEGFDDSLILVAGKDISIAALAGVGRIGRTF